MFKQQLILPVAIASLLLLVGSNLYTHHRGVLAGEAKGKALVAETYKSAYEGKMKALVAEAAASKALNAELLDRIAKLPTSTSVKETIRENPSKCVVPEPVARSLQNLASGIDAARASERGSGAVSKPEPARNGGEAWWRR